MQSLGPPRHAAATASTSVPTVPTSEIAAYAAPVSASTKAGTSQKFAPRAPTTAFPCFDPWPQVPVPGSIPLPMGHRLDGAVILGTAGSAAGIMLSPWLAPQGWDDMGASCLLGAMGMLAGGLGGMLLGPAMAPGPCKPSAAWRA